MRFFSHVELAYDVAMRCNIPVNILFTSFTKEQQTILIIKYCLAGCDIGSLLFGIGKMSVTRCTKFQGLKYLGHGPLSNCQKFTCTQFVGAIYEKLDSTSLIGVSLAKAATKVLSTDNSFHLNMLHSICPPPHIDSYSFHLNMPHSICPPHKIIMDKI